MPCRICRYAERRKQDATFGETCPTDRSPLAAESTRENERKGSVSLERGSNDAPTTVRYESISRKPFNTLEACSRENHRPFELASPNVVKANTYLLSSHRKLSSLSRRRLSSPDKLERIRLTTEPFRNINSLFPCALIRRSSILFAETGLKRPNDGFYVGKTRQCVLQNMRFT